MTFLYWRALGAILTLTLTGQSPIPIPFEAGMVIDRSVAIRDDAYRLSASAGLARLLSSAPLEPSAACRLDDVSGREREDRLPRDRVAPVAEGTATLPPGDYALQVISDDGVRVWMDGAMIFDEWIAHESKVSRVTIGGGIRRFKVKYDDATGFAELRFDIQRK